MKTYMLVAVVCLFSLVLTDANPVCQMHSSMENFNMEQFMGTWHWNMISPNVYSQGGNRCPVSIIHMRENGTMSYVLKYINSGESQYTVKEGNVWHCSSHSNDGRLMVEMPTDHGYWEARWWILGTDYENYAASYGCWTAADGNFRGWSLGWCRQKVCSEEHKNAIKRIFEDHHLDVNTLEDLHEGDCPAL